MFIFARLFQVQEAVNRHSEVDQIARHSEAEGLTLSLSSFIEDETAAISLSSKVTNTYTSRRANTLTSKETNENMSISIADKTRVQKRKNYLKNKEELCMERRIRYQKNRESEIAVVTSGRNR